MIIVARSVNVGMFVRQIAAGHVSKRLLLTIEREDIVQALRYAEWRAEECGSARGRKFCFALGHAAAVDNKGGAGEIADAAQ